jgi:C-terminal processing protease CtpA/Prc
MEHTMQHTIRNLIVTALLLALLVPGMASAQTVVFGDGGRRGWLGISYDSRPSGDQQAVRPVIRITDVVKDSPAEKAGLHVGDVIVSVNDIPASNQLISSLAYSLAPGESVRLRVRRESGGEHDVTIVTAAQPARAFGAGGREIITIDMDSVRTLTRVWFDSARIHLDTMNLPRMFHELPYGREFPSPDSLRAHVFRQMQFDTLTPGRARIYRMDGDTLLRAEMDSVIRRITSATALPFGDSVRVQTWRGMPPGAFDGTTFFAMRTIGGAELADIDPAMETYFGTREGVLVLRVGAETPAARAGLRAGDVIVAVNDEAIGNAAEMRRRISDAERGRPLRLDVLRERRALRIELGGS